MTAEAPAAAVRLRLAFAVALDRLDEFEALFSQSVADSLAEVADSGCGTVGYSAFLDRTTGRVVAYEHHTDVAALLAHLARNPERRRAMTPMFTGAPELEVYGDPTPELLEVLGTLRLSPVVFGGTLGVDGAL